MANARTTPAVVRSEARLRLRKANKRLRVARLDTERAALAAKIVAYEWVAREMTRIIDGIEAKAKEAAENERINSTKDDRKA